MHVEFTDDTLVATERGIEKLRDILHRPVEPCLWAVKWPSCMSFHATHKDVKKFVDVQVHCVPQGPARLVDVSASILAAVIEDGYVVTDLTEFDQALTHEVHKPWKH